MPIYEFAQDRIVPLQATTFGTVGLRERSDLQRLLRESIDVIAPETLVIAEEFGEWEDSRRRIDLLAIDKAANLVVIELKRTEDGGHMELQSIRYAAMVSTMTFDRATEVFARYLQQMGQTQQDPRSTILDFLSWDEPKEGFAQDVRIVLASAEFSKELTSSVLWLNEREVDIRCVRLQPYTLEGRTLVDVQQVIPLPEAAEYQVQVREKVREERQARAGATDFTRFDVKVGDEQFPEMWKRNAIFVICVRLCKLGVRPEAIAGLFPWRTNRVWYFVDGSVDETDFRDLASRKAAGDGPAFNPQRWFCGDGELIHADAKTYAFSNQWGGETWHRAMGILKEKYPEFKIDFKATS